MIDMESPVVIVVNATAARESGALTILWQFLAAAAKYGGDDSYIVFAPTGVEFDLDSDNVSIVKVDTQRWKERVRWDKKGLGLYLEAKCIRPDLIVSLQNTGVNYNKEVPQIIYYHQLLPLEKFRWNPLKPSQRKYFLYKHLYPYFVRKYLNRVVSIVVQRESLKELFVYKFRYHVGSVTTLRPDMPEINPANVGSDLFRDEKIHLFYPATAQIYKNHRVLVDAADILRDRGYGNIFKIHLTGSEDDSMSLWKKICKMELQDCFVFEGNMQFKKVLSVYNSSSALLFPSYIETYGLPLTEAMAFGLPIICSDLTYAHEVLGDYQGVEYVPYQDAARWADAIEHRLNNPHERFSCRVTGKGDWDKFITLCRQTALRK